MVKHTQFVRKLPTNSLSVFDHFVGLALTLKELMEQKFEVNTFMKYNLPTYFFSWCIVHGKVKGSSKQ